MTINTARGELWQTRALNVPQSDQTREKWRRRKEEEKRQFNETGVTGIRRDKAMGNNKETKRM